MINNFIYDDVSNAILNANTALNEITKSITSATAKPYFIYAYSLFESTITEITRYYIKAFPHINDLKSRAASLSKSEHLFLAIFLQQYNNDLNSYINNFNQIPSLVSIDTHNKAKLVELIDFFDSFPLLFNGERIR